MNLMTEAKPIPAAGVAGTIRQYIKRHGLLPGDQLPRHDELARKLKLGPRRLREGLSILQFQGLVETRNKGGTIVRKPNLESINEPIRWHLDSAGCSFEDLVSTRAWLESGAAAEAAKKRTARDLLKVLDALEQLEALIDEERTDWVEDTAFHLAILEASHNSVIVTFGQLVRLNFQSNDAARPQPADWRREFNRQHRSIYEAIERRDSAAARELMYAHIMDQLGHLRPVEGDKC
jgi:GntR family transcriptional repressor for pyruvate dehydrogenase complex